jgi:hypothetical protein
MAHTADDAVSGSALERPCDDQTGRHRIPVSAARDVGDEDLDVVDAAGHFLVAAISRACDRAVTIWRSRQPPCCTPDVERSRHSFAAWRTVEAMAATMEVLSLPVTIDGSDVLRRAVAGYLARYKGLSRSHTESDLRVFLGWCTARGLEPLAAQRPHIELYIRWMQEIRRFKPSTVSRRMSIVAGFYRTCVIDGVLPASPAEHVRRPNVPPESPTLGLTHLQFEAMLTAAREWTNPNDFALVTMLGLLGLRIFEATGADITDLGEEHGHRVLKVHGKGDRVVLVPLPPAVGLALDRAAAGRTEGPLLRNNVESGWTATPRPFGCVTWRTPAACGSPG